MNDLPFPTIKLIVIIIVAGAGVGWAGSSRLTTPDWVWCLDSLSWLEFNLITKLADITGLAVIKKCHQWPLTSSIIHSKQISFIFIHCIFYRVDLLLLSLMTAHSSSHSIRLGQFSAGLETDIRLERRFSYRQHLHRISPKNLLKLSSPNTTMNPLLKIIITIQTCSTPLVFTLSASGLSAVSRALWVNKYQTTSTNTPNNTILYYNSTSLAVCRGPPVYLQNSKIAIPFNVTIKMSHPWDYIM